MASRNEFTSETMSLSTAIRLGSLLKPQAFGEYFNRGGGSCALGAALDAAGLTADVNECNIWPVLNRINEEGCPVCSRTGIAVVPHLNDNHEWSRERIASYVEQFESVQEPAAETVTTA